MPMEPASKAPPACAVSRLRHLSWRRRLAALGLALLATWAPGRAAQAFESGDSAGAPGAEPAGVQKLPVLEGRTLDGKPLSTRAFAGKRLVLFCFNPGIDQAADYARVLAKIAPERTRHNFAIAGVAMGLDPGKSREFVARHALDFPVFDDSGGDLAVRLGLRSPLLLVGSDAEGRVGLVMAGFQHEAGHPAAAVEGRLREYLRLPSAEGVDGRLDTRPLAPAFEAERAGSGPAVRLADFAGRPVVLVFFLSSCSHCQDALRFFKDELARMPEKHRPAFVGIANDARTYGVEDTLAAKKLDFFPVLVDRDRSIATSYGSFALVPDIVMIDAEGRILFRSTGWKSGHDPDVMRMRLARLAGREVPMLLSRDGFSGNDACAVCHPSQAATWSFTSHALAFDTLVARAAERDAKCVGCHVVGFGERGGYTVAAQEGHLENVGCENCHERGGGHLPAAKGTAAKSPADYRPACAKCHDETHSLGFDYDSFLPRVSHAAIAAMGEGERARLLSERHKPRDLLPATSAFAGSAACRDCHRKEYDIWLGSAHARSIESIRKKGKEGDAACVSCHVTGYGRPGGFPEGGRARSHEDLARVGCESCHGPGADHVKEEGKRPAGIVRLGDKCDSCVILQICGACHDDDNDPDFRFRVEQKIEAQRHGARP